MQQARVAIVFAVIVSGTLLTPAVGSEVPVGQLPMGHLVVVPGQLQWSDVASLPAGAKMATVQGSMSEAAPFTVRLKLPANYLVPAHFHPRTEHVTVLSGTLHLGMGDKLDKTRGSALPVGSVAIMDAGTNHFAWTTRETVLQLQGVGPWGITYVNPADDPRNR